MFKFEYLQNGSIRIFSSFVPSHRFLLMWEQDKNDPQIFHPKFPECSRRKYEFTVLQCGKTFGRYQCDTGETVTVLKCEDCLKNK
jgi:hypothetical protein